MITLVNNIGFSECLLSIVKLILYEVTGHGPTADINPFQTYLCSSQLAMKACSNTRQTSSKMHKPQNLHRGSDSAGSGWGLKIHFPGNGNDIGKHDLRGSYFPLHMNCEATGRILFQNNHCHHHHNCHNCHHHHHYCHHLWILVLVCPRERGNEGRRRKSHFQFPHQAKERLLSTFLIITTWNLEYQAKVSQGKGQNPLNMESE